MKEYRLFLDDYRVPLDSFGITRNPIYKEKWIIVRTYEDFLKTISHYGIPTMVSFDHDLVDEHYKVVNESQWEEYHKNPAHQPTGYDCALWLKRYCSFNNLPLPEYYIHSLSQVGGKKIRKLLG